MPVPLLADECCDGELVLLLRQAGHDVRYVAEGDTGHDDDQVLQLAVREGRVLLTEDTDFGELVVRLGKPAVGVILLRLAKRPWRRRLRGCGCCSTRTPGGCAGTTSSSVVTGSVSGFSFDPCCEHALGAAARKEGSSAV